MFRTPAALTVKQGVIGRRKMSVMLDTPGRGVYALDGGAIGAGVM